MGTLADSAWTIKASGKTYGGEEPRNQRSPPALCPILTRWQTDCARPDERSQKHWTRAPLMRDKMNSVTSTTLAHTTGALRGSFAWTIA